MKGAFLFFSFRKAPRSKDGKLKDFKEGGFKIATKAKCPVIPVGIQGTADIFENHLPFIRPSKVIVTFGEPIDTEHMDRAQAKLLPET